MTQRIATSSTRQFYRRIIQNFVIIWLDSNINESNADYRNAITYLRRIVNPANIFTDPDTCIDFLTEIKNEKIIMIVSDHFSKLIVSLMQQIEQVHSIYILCDNKAEHKLEAYEQSKVKGVFSQIEPLCDSLERYTRHQEKDSISVIPLVDASNPELDRLDQSFMYSQLLKEILLKIDEDDEKAKKQFIEFLRDQYSNNDNDLKQIDEFERDYDVHTPIWWYTKVWLIYSRLNQALRTQDTEIIIKMGFFVRDLHRQIERLHAESADSREPIIVYRGQGMLHDDFEKIKSSTGGLLSFNNFLSTSIDRQVSLMFAESSQTDPNLTGILFHIKVEPELTSVPFASLDKISYFSDQEKEILFSMHTVFRIGEINQVQDGLWQVELTLTGDNDQQLMYLTDYIREQIGGGTGWHQLGNLLIRIGEFDQAEEVYKTLLDSTLDNDQMAVAIIQNQLAYINEKKGDYYSAFSFSKKTLEMQQKYLSSDHHDLVATYTNMGIAHQKMGNYHSALSFYQKTLEILQKSLPSNSLLMAITYSNIGEIHQEMGDYTNALSFYQKTLEIQQKELPPNHPELAATYSNMGLIHQGMAEYSFALSFYQKALEIGQKSLPPNHPDLATNYNNIAQIHESMGEYLTALSFYRRALEIDQKSLPPNHPSLATNYNNIGEVHRKMGDYTSALSSFEKTLAIQQKSLSPDHPHLVSTYINIGGLHHAMGKYSIALSFYEKTIAIQQKSLPPNHPILANIYNNIGGVHGSMGDDSNALSFYQKALEIFEKSLFSNHPLLSSIYNNIGGIHQSMGNYSTALTFYRKTLEIVEKFFPPDHPSLATAYNNIGGLHQMIGDYTSALSFYKETIRIIEKLLPPDHPHLASVYNNIGEVHREMGDYLTALSFYQKTLEIQEKSVPLNYPLLASVYNNIGLIHYSIEDYSSAFSFFQKTFEIREKFLPSNHADLAATYNNIGAVHRKMRNDSIALLFYQKALEIYKLLPNHPTLPIIYNNVATAFEDLHQLHEAVQHGQRAFDIACHTLGPNHPHTLAIRKNLDGIQKKL